MKITIAAIVANAHRDDPDVECVVAYQHGDNWYDANDHQIWPFWTTEIELNIPSIPEGFLEYLREQARLYAVRKPRAQEASGADLLAALGLPTKLHANVSGTLNRRM